MLPLIEQELIAKRGWIEHKEFLDLLTSHNPSWAPSPSTPRCS